MAAPKQSPLMEGRNGQIYRKWSIYGWSQERIAEEYGISQQRVNQVIARVRESLGPIDRQVMIQQSIETLAEIKARALEIADLTPAPVVAGKDGTKVYEDVLDEDGNPVLDSKTNLPMQRVVRDYSARLKALAELRATDEQIAKRFGLSAPDRLEVSGGVKYEIVGADPSDLT